MTPSGEARKFGNYCFTLRAFATLLSPDLPPSDRAFFFFPRKSKILPTSPGREDARQGEKREISKCSGIIKVYRFTAGRFSYANLAGGHPLGLFLQISPAACVREKWQTSWENALSFTTTLLSNKWKVQYMLHNCTVSMQCCAINYTAHFATFPRIFIYFETYSSNVGKKLR